jgi:hypothetical protein
VGDRGRVRDPKSLEPLGQRLDLITAYDAGGFEMLRRLGEVVRNQLEPELGLASNSMDGRARASRSQFIRLARRSGENHGFEGLRILAARR